MRHWYANLNKKNVFATSVGLAALCGLIVGLVFTFRPEPEHIVGTSVFCCALTVPMALYYWIGKGAVELGIDSWIGWLGMFFLGSLASILFIAIDCGWRNPFGEETVSCQPGLSGVFTLGVVVLTVIALPSALRAWLLHR
ncbi:hypothetical protein IV454_00360 [Massilia antarctica]|uniref:Integron gene cassette protein n=1 Tax=Massilia antarctica TaxID=2765360 RepID=A0AA49A898_9BURK|nr:MULTISPECIES: hypothetical protein [Massilia]MCY0911471.1 hypothetical protein [Massilia sp. H27-R4]QPI50134.1 hypothetical protein IV454_00360 [Massilia antarctica]CUI04922.1 hypothetical protein BN2497_4621 [Janthinobacterium sp. CG23_2]CUU28708.1 hypothetical protein BN3177_4621 [Janthinobacterium sp. CG23_2]